MPVRIMIQREFHRWVEWIICVWVVVTERNRIEISSFKVTAIFHLDPVSIAAAISHTPTPPPLLRMLHVLEGIRNGFNKIYLSLRNAACGIITKNILYTFALSVIL